MERSDLTIEILRDLRDEARSTNEQLRGLSGEFHGLSEDFQGLTERFQGLTGQVQGLTGQVQGLTGEVRNLKDDVCGTNARLDRLERRQSEAEIRLATELVAVTAAVREVRDELRDGNALRVRVDDHERRITAVEQRGG